MGRMVDEDGCPLYDDADAEWYEGDKTAYKHENSLLRAEVKRLQRYVTERDHYRRQWSEGRAEIERLTAEVATQGKGEAEAEIGRLRSRITMHNDFEESQRRVIERLQAEIGRLQAVILKAKE